MRGTSGDSRVEGRAVDDGRELAMDMRELEVEVWEGGAGIKALDDAGG